MALSKKEKVIGWSIVGGTAITAATLGAWLFSGNVQETPDATPAPVPTAPADLDLSDRPSTSEPVDPDARTNFSYRWQNGDYEAFVPRDRKSHMMLSNTKQLNKFAKGTPEDLVLDMMVMDASDGEFDSDILAPHIKDVALSKFVGYMKDAESKKPYLKSHLDKIRAAYKDK